jgi:hypothetical protein
MAAIDTDEKFRLAASVWMDTNPGIFQGTRFVDAGGRKILDERINSIVDVTPGIATLESALDTANTNVSDENTVFVSQDIAKTARTYIRNQLRSANPNLGTIFTTIKSFVDNNPQLLTSLNNNIDVMALAYGWNAVNVKAATGASTNQLKAQYVEAVKSIVAVFA